jgi:CRP-like cAMP-binding protein
VTNQTRRVAALFGTSDLFSRLSPRDRDRLARRATIRRYPAGSIIVREGDTSMTLYVVLAGRVGVEVQTRRVRELASGAFFGEMGLVDDHPRSASVIALDDTECALLGAWDVRQHGGLALGLLPILVQRLREHSGQSSTVADADWLSALG